MPEPTAPAGFRLPVDVRRFPSMRRLASDYAYDFSNLADFFAGNPAEPQAWRSAIARTKQLSRPSAEIAAVVAEQQRRHLAPAAAVEAAERLSDRNTVAIVTGQQAGLFGGPLYTLLKAITAVKLAAHVRDTYSVPAVAVFWVEAEDHDWDEVASCSVLDRDFVRHKVTLPSLPGAGSAPIGTIRLNDAARPIVQTLGELLQPTEFTSSVLNQLEGAYGANATMSDAFSRWMLHLLGEHGLVLFDASDPAAKPFVSKVFSTELERPGQSSHLAREAGERLIARGYHAQSMPADEGVALFHLDGARTPIGHPSPNGERGLDALLKEVHNRPSAFSPNVLLRPVVQDSLFPTIAYVAGPNELAYLGQLRQVYDHFSVPMPLMYPRASATLLDSAAMKFLARTGLPFEALARNDEGELNRLLEQQLPEAVERAWEDARSGVEQRMQSLVEALPQLDPTLEGAARSTLGRMRHDLEALHGKIVHAAKRRDETMRRQFGHTRALAFPDGEPQERAVGFVYFLNRYGPWLIERLMSDLPLEMGQHWVLAI